jgi:hypothetical protein
VAYGKSPPYKISSGREDVKPAMGLYFGQYKNADCFIFP